MATTRVPTALSVATFEICRPTAADAVLSRRLSVSWKAGELLDGRSDRYLQGPVGTPPTCQWGRWVSSLQVCLADSLNHVDSPARHGQSTPRGLAPPIPLVIYELSADLNHWIRGVERDRSCPPSDLMLSDFASVHCCLCLVLMHYYSFWSCISRLDNHQSRQTLTNSYRCSSSSVILQKCHERESRGSRRRLISSSLYRLPSELIAGSASFQPNDQSSVHCAPGSLDRCTPVVLAFPFHPCNPE